PDVGDTQAPDIDVGPCLSDLGQDTGPCLSIPHDSGSATPDADDSGDGTADGDGKGTASKDTKTGPCLSPPAPDTSWLAPETLQNQADPRAVPSRDAVRRKLAAAGVLPTDLAEKLAKMRS
ncbi:MAG: hypothetical protein KC502_23290, partial [Myxococcales bacterium]|nr:hypothetical protein [Myxococcales bacterium]